MKKMEADVIVVAAGPAGLAAAITAGENDLKAIVFEKSNTTGGAANMGMGPLGIGTKIQKKEFKDLTLEEAGTDPRRENLTSYIGRGFPGAIEWNKEPVSLLPGDQILLVSDGVYRALSQNELENCLYKSTAQETAQSMRTLIQKKDFPNQDNYTGIVIRIG